MNFTLSERQCPCILEDKKPCSHGGIVEFQGYCAIHWKQLSQAVEPLLKDESTPTPTARYILPPQPNRWIRLADLLWKIGITILVVLLWKGRQ